MVMGSARGSAPHLPPVLSWRPVFSLHMEAVNQCPPVPLPWDWEAQGWGLSPHTSLSFGVSSPQGAPKPSPAALLTFLPLRPGLPSSPGLPWGEEEAVRAPPKQAFGGWRGLGASVGHGAGHGVWCWVLTGRPGGPKGPTAPGGPCSPRSPGSPCGERRRGEASAARFGRREQGWGWCTGQEHSPTRYLHPGRGPPASPGPPVDEEGREGCGFIPRASPSQISGMVPLPHHLPQPPFPVPPARPHTHPQPGGPWGPRFPFQPIAAVQPRWATLPL